MTKEKILEVAKTAAENFPEGDFFIGCKVEEILPNNKNKTTLICVDCSWLRPYGQEPIIDRNDLDDIIANDISANISVKIDKDFNDIVFTKWVDMVDADGDIHHCKLESFAELTDNIYRPIEDDEIDWAVYIEI